MALVTSGSEKTVVTAVEEFKPLQLIDVVVHRDMVTQVKPDPEALLLAAKKLGVSPEACVMVGDLPLDVMAARNAGMKSVAVLGRLREYTEQIIADSEPNYTIDTIGGLIPLLDGEFSHH